jgi:hypothetical protein
MSLINFGNHNARIFKNIHWIGNCEAITGLYQTVSRCNYVPDFFDYKLTVTSIQEVKKYTTHNYNFSEIMDARAISLLKESISSEKNIMVMYSGGIDSTAICVSLLKNFNELQKSKVIILCTPQSYLEFPTFFKMLSKNFTIKYCSNNLEKYVNDNILVTGMTGDLLFASNGWIERGLAISDDLPKQNFKIAIPKILETIYPNYGDKIFDLYYPIVEESLFKITTASEFIYWFYYTQCYQMVFYAYLRYMNAFTNSTTFSRLYNFYDTPMFEYWSLNNIDKTIPYSNLDFKKPIKDYINEYVKDEIYISKQKFPSYGEVIEGNRFTYGLTEDWNFLDFDQSLKYFKFPK